MNNRLAASVCLTEPHPLAASVRKMAGRPFAAEATLASAPVPIWQASSPKRTHTRCGSVGQTETKYRPAPWHGTNLRPCSAIQYDTPLSSLRIAFSSWLRQRRKASPTKDRRCYSSHNHRPRLSSTILRHCTSSLMCLTRHDTARIGGE